MVRKLIAAAVILGVVAGPAAAPALAQVALSPFNAPTKRGPTQEEIERKKAADAAYQAAVAKIPEKTGGVDPWGTVRGAPTSTTTPTSTAAPTAASTPPAKSPAKTPTKTAAKTAPKPPAKTAVKPPAEPKPPQ
jgi:hypothetical protein